MKHPKRSQRVMVVQRRSDGMFWKQQKNGIAQWTPDIREANFISPNRVKGLVRATWGRDLEEFRALEVVPALMDEQENQ